VGAVAKTIEVQEFDESAWAPYGWVPFRDTDSHDGDHRLTFEWDDVHLNVIGHSLDEVERTDRGLRCDVLYHHVTHTQAVMPLNCDCIFVVAPAGTDIEGPGDLEDVRAFLIHPLQTVVLHQGTWHWGPYPLDDVPVSLLNVQGLRYAEDNGQTDLAGLDLALEIALPS
jgi:ureidoglycolate lyase